DQLQEPPAPALYQSRQRFDYGPLGHGDARSSDRGHGQVTETAPPLALGRLTQWVLSLQGDEDAQRAGNQDAAQPARNAASSFGHAPTFPGRTCVRRRGAD